MAKSPIERPRDFRATVHPVRLKTVGYLVWASAEPQRLCDEEVRRIAGNRRLRSLSASNLPSRRPASWVLAMLVAAPDEILPLAEWASSLTPADRGRVILFLLAATDAAEVERSWEEKLGEQPLMHAVEASFPSLHAPFGRFLNEWTYKDAKAGRI